MAIHWNIISTAITGFSCLAYPSVFWQYSRFLKLKNKGQANVARIDALKKERSITRQNVEWRYTVSYRYRDGDGHEFRHHQQIDPALWETLREGQNVDIVYLPGKPSVSTPAMSLDQQLRQYAYYRYAMPPVLLFMLLFSLLASALL